MLNTREFLGEKNNFFTTDFFFAEGLPRTFWFSSANFCRGQFLWIPRAANDVPPSTRKPIVNILSIQKSIFYGTDFMVHTGIVPPCFRVHADM